MGYCAREVMHLNSASGQEASAIYLTIENVDANTAAIEIESADSDPVNELEIIGSGATSFSPTNRNTTVTDGKIRTELTYTTPPSDLRDLGDLEILWSKASTGNRWVLREVDMHLGALPFDAVCGE